MTLILSDTYTILLLGVTCTILISIDTCTELILSVDYTILISSVVLPEKAENLRED